MSFERGSPPSRKKANGTYRKVEVKTWSDDRFRRLSPMLPCGQGLWLYLLTGPHTTSLPCAFRASRVAMADDLGWAQEDFDQAMGEILIGGMAKADFAARMVLLPNGCKYNPPNGPNTVTAWARAWADLPDCRLKAECYELIKSFIANESDALRDAFAAAFPQAYQIPSSMPSGMPSSMALGIHNITEQSTNLSKEGNLPRCSTPPGKIVHLPRTRVAQDFENGGCA